MPLPGWEMLKPFGELLGAGRCARDEGLDRRSQPRWFGGSSMFFRRYSAHCSDSFFELTNKHGSEKNGCYVLIVVILPNET
jgi:hypothetical protein